MTRYAISRRRICRVMQFSRTTDYYKSHKDPQELPRMRLRDLAFSRIRYGYRRFHVLLRREGWKVNLKRVHRLNRLEGLSNRKKTPRRKVSSQKRENRPLVQSPNQVWSMDFMSDTLANGQSARILTILDVCTRESIAIWEDSRFSANKVVRVLEEIAMKRGKPNSICLVPIFRSTVILSILLFFHPFFGHGLFRGINSYSLISRSSRRERPLIHS